MDATRQYDKKGIETFRNAGTNVLKPFAMRFHHCRRSALWLAAFCCLSFSARGCDINEWQYEGDKRGGRIRWIVTKSGFHHEFGLKNIGSTWVTIDGIYVNDQRVSWEGAGLRIGPSGRYASEGDRTRWMAFTATLPCQFRVRWHSNLAWNEPFGLGQPNFVSAVGEPDVPALTGIAQAGSRRR